MCIAAVTTLVGPGKDIPTLPADTTYLDIHRVNASFRVPFPLPDIWTACGKGTGVTLVGPETRLAFSALLAARSALRSRRAFSISDILRVCPARKARMTPAHTDRLESNAFANR